MPARQQRAALNRRPARPNTPPLVPTVVAQIGSLTTHTLDVTFWGYSQPPTGSAAAQRMVLSGVPAILRTAGTTLPTAATLSADGLTVTLTYAGADLTTADSFWLGAYDPALRTFTGGYAAPAVLTSALIPPSFATPLPVIDGVDPHIVHVGWNPAGGDSKLWSPMRMFAVSDGAYPTAAVYTSNSDADLTFAANQTASNTLRYDGPEVTATAGTTYVPIRSAVPMT